MLAVTEEVVRWVTVEALSCELAAIDTVAIDYMQFLMIKVPQSPERDEVIETLKALRKRYSDRYTHRCLLPDHVCKEPTNKTLVKVKITTNELIAFASAAVGYSKMIRYYGENEQTRQVSDHVSRFQQRYLKQAGLTRLN